MPFRSRRQNLYGSYKNPRDLVWIFGILIYLCLMAALFENWDAGDSQNTARRGMRQAYERIWFL